MDFGNARNEEDSDYDVPLPLGYGSMPPTLLAPEDSMAARLRELEETKKAVLLHETEGLCSDQRG